MPVCANTSTNQFPLFPGIFAPLTAAHQARGVAAAGEVAKVDGKCVVLFVGMSNFRQESAATIRLVKAAGIRHVIFHNGGRGAWDLRRMVDFSDEYWAWLKAKMVKWVITPAQVQVLFLKNSVKGGAEEWEYEGLLEEQIFRACAEFPNLKQIFISSAIYSGYANKPLPRSEPQAHDEGVAVGNVLADAANWEDMPWIGPGPYLWADGEVQRGDGLEWRCIDFEFDGVHPGPLAEAKVAEMYFRFLQTSPVTQWFREAA